MQIRELKVTATQARMYLELTGDAFAAGSATFFGWAHEELNEVAPCADIANVARRYKPSPVGNAYARPDKRVVCSGFGKTEQRLQRFSVDTTRDLLSGNVTGRTCVTVNKYIAEESQRARVLAAIRMREDEQ